MKLFWCNYLRAECSLFLAHGGWVFMATMLLSMREFFYTTLQWEIHEFYSVIVELITESQWLCSASTLILPLSLCIREFTMAPQSLRFTAQKTCHGRVRRPHHSHTKATMPLHSSHAHQNYVQACRFQMISRPGLHRHRWKWLNSCRVGQ